MPPLKTLRGMTPPDFRTVIAIMLQSFGHTLITGPSTSDLLVTMRNDRKFITACATPTDPVPTKLTALHGLHEAVIKTNAVRGFHITRRFPREAEQLAASAGIKPL
ncbi:MAG: hypothetical protein ACREDA_11295 [Methylocella sp.]